MQVVGVDVSDIFTDLIMLDIDTGRVSLNKVSSTIDPTEGIFNAFQKSKLDLSHLQRFIHGTTVATNALIQRKGVKTALITTQGFRDGIEICNNRRYTGGLFNPKWVRMKPLVPRPLRFEVNEITLYTAKILNEL